MEFFLNIIHLLMLTKLCTVLPADGSGHNLELECKSNFTDFEIPLNPFLLNSLTFYITNSSVTIIYVNSPKCCNNISFESEDKQCYDCSGSGIKTCYVFNTEVSVNPIPDECLNNTRISLSCSAQFCSEKISVDNTSVFRPGESTGCLPEGEIYECTKIGNWEKSACSPHEMSTVTEKYETTTIVSNNNVSQVHVIITTNEPVEHGLSTSPSTISTTTFVTSKGISHMTTSTVLDIWETEIKNKSDTDISNTTASTSSVPATNGNVFWNDTSAQTTIDSEQAMKDLYTFLIVLGVVLFLVFILVCGFFIRKQKDKISITHVDYPLEYWHDQEYIDNIVEKSYTPKSAFTVNPMYGSGKDTPTNSQTRYKKKDESDYKSRRKAPSERGNNGGSENPKKSNATRKRSNGSASDRSNCDRPRRTKHDYADKYVATAVGSNFYSYSQNQSEDVIKKTTDLDLSTEDEGNIGYIPNVQSGTGSFHPPRNGRNHRKSRAGSQQEHGYTPDDPYHDVDLGEYDNYAHVYKERLRRGLEDLSAEESDV